MAGLGEAKPQPSPLCTATARGGRQPPQPSPGTPPRPRGAQRPPGCHRAPRRGVPHSSLPVLLTDPTSTRRHCGALDQCKPVQTSANQPLRTTALPNTQDRAEAWSNKASHGCAHIHVCVPTRTHPDRSAHTQVHTSACRHTCARRHVCKHACSCFTHASPTLPPPAPLEPPVMPPHSHTLSPPTGASHVCTLVHACVSMCACLYTCVCVCVCVPPLQGVQPAPGAHAGAPSVPLVTAPGLRWHLEPTASQAFCGWF